MKRSGAALKNKETSNYRMKIYNRLFISDRQSHFEIPYDLYLLHVWGFLLSTLTDDKLKFVPCFFYQLSIDKIMLN
jgi:hypothetical protein